MTKKNQEYLKFNNDILLLPIQEKFNILSFFQTTVTGLGNFILINLKSTHKYQISFNRYPDKAKAMGDLKFTDVELELCINKAIIGIYDYYIKEHKSDFLPYYSEQQELNYLRVKVQELEKEVEYWKLGTGNPYEDKIPGFWINDTGETLKTTKRGRPKKKSPKDKKNDKKAEKLSKKRQNLSKKLKTNKYGFTAKDIINSMETKLGVDPDTLDDETYIKEWKKAKSRIRVSFYTEEKKKLKTEWGGLFL